MWRTTCRGDAGCVVPLPIPATTRPDSVLPAGRRSTAWKRIGPVPGEDPLGELFRMRLVWIKPEVVPQLSSQIPGELARLFSPLEATQESEQAVVFI